MKVRINKIINWQGKEYAHIIEAEPAEYCDLCAFSNLCEKAILGQIPFKDSPIPLCDKLCEEAGGIHFASFIEASKAEDYVKARNGTV